MPKCHLKCHGCSRSRRAHACYLQQIKELSDVLESAMLEHSALKSEFGESQKSLNFQISAVKDRCMELECRALQERERFQQEQCQMLMISKKMFVWGGERECGRKRDTSTVKHRQVAIALCRILIVCVGDFDRQLARMRCELEQVQAVADAAQSQVEELKSVVASIDAQSHPINTDQIALLNDGRSTTEAVTEARLRESELFIEGWRMGVHRDWPISLEDGETCVFQEAVLFEY